MPSEKRESSVLLSVDEEDAWKESGLSLTDLIEAGVKAAEADPGVLRGGAFRRNMAATGKPGRKFNLHLPVPLAGRLDAVKAAGGVGTPAVFAAGLAAAEAARQGEALGPLMGRLEDMIRRVVREELAAALGNGAKAHPASSVAVPFREPGQ